MAADASGIWQEKAGLLLELAVQTRERVAAPLLRAAVWLCMLMSLMLVAEKLLMAAASLYAKLFRCRPKRRSFPLPFPSLPSPPFIVHNFIHTHTH